MTPFFSAHHLDHPWFLSAQAQKADTGVQVGVSGGKPEPGVPSPPVRGIRRERGAMVVSTGISHTKWP